MHFTGQAGKTPHPPVTEITVASSKTFYICIHCTLCALHRASWKNTTSSSHRNNSCSIKNILHLYSLYTLCTSQGKLEKTPHPPVTEITVASSKTFYICIHCTLCAVHRASWKNTTSSSHRNNSCSIKKILHLHLYSLYTLCTSQGKLEKHHILQSQK